MKKVRITPLRFLIPRSAHGSSATSAMPVRCQPPTGAIVDELLFATPVLTVTVAYLVTPLATGNMAGLTYRLHSEGPRYIPSSGCLLIHSPESPGRQRSPSVRSQSRQTMSRLRGSESLRLNQ